MLFLRVSLLVYVSLAVSSTLALPTSSADLTSDVLDDPMPHSSHVSRSIALVSRWLDDIDMTVSRRQELSSAGALVNITNLPPVPTAPGNDPGTPPPLYQLDPEANSGRFCNGALCGSITPNPCNSEIENCSNGLPSLHCSEHPEELACDLGLDAGLRKRILNPEVQTPPEVQTSSKVSTLPNIWTHPKAREISNVRKPLKARRPRKARGPAKGGGPPKIRSPPASQLGALD